MNVREQLERLDEKLGLLVPVVEDEESYMVKGSKTYFDYNVLFSREETAPILDQAVDVRLLTICVCEDVEEANPLMPIEVCVAIAFYNGERLGLTHEEVGRHLEEAYADVVWQDGEEAVTLSDRLATKASQRAVRVVGRRLHNLELELKEMGVQGYCRWASFLQYLCAGYYGDSLSKIAPTEKDA